MGGVAQFEYAKELVKADNLINIQYLICNGQKKCKDSVKVGGVVRQTPKTQNVIIFVLFFH